MVFLNPIYLKFFNSKSLNPVKKTTTTATNRDFCRFFNKTAATSHIFFFSFLSPPSLSCNPTCNRPKSIKINSGEKGNEEWLPEIWRQTTQQRKEEEVEQRDGNVVKGIIGRFFFFFWVLVLGGYVLVLFELLLLSLL